MLPKLLAKTFLVMDEDEALNFMPPVTKNRNGLPHIFWEEVDACSIVQVIMDTKELKVK